MLGQWRARGSRPPRPRSRPRCLSSPQSGRHVSDDCYDRRIRQGTELALTSLVSVAQNRLLTYLDLPSLTTRRPKSLPSLVVGEEDLLLLSPARAGPEPDRGRGTCSCVEPPAAPLAASSSSTDMPMPWMTPSSRRSLFMSSPSGGFLGRLLARSGAGNMHCTFALAQLEQG